MLQRIQTIFLLLAMLSSLVLLIDPMSLVTVSGDTQVLRGMVNTTLDDGVFHVTDHVLLLVLVGLAGVLALISIFQFRKRLRQMSMARLVIVANILILFLAGFFFYQDYTRLEDGAYLFEVEYGAIAPILAILFCILALRYIRKDERLVRSMDRLR